MKEAVKRTDREIGRVRQGLEYAMKQIHDALDDLEDAERAIRTERNLERGEPISRGSMIEWVRADERRPGESTFFWSVAGKQYNKCYLVHMKGLKGVTIAAYDHGEFVAMEKGMSNLPGKVDYWAEMPELSEVG